LFAACVADELKNYLTAYHAIAATAPFFSSGDRLRADRWRQFESKNQIAPVRLTDYTEVEEEQRKNRKEEEACLYGGLLGEQFFHDLWDNNTLADDHRSEGGKI
jgi:hypothetical protein